MKQKRRWFELIFLNSYWFGINLTTGVITPVLLPYLILTFMPANEKNTHLATVRVIGLTVAMFVQPLSGMLSDRSTAKLGRRRPFIIAGAILNATFLLLIGSSLLFQNSGFVGKWPLSYIILLLGIIFWQFASNLGHGGLLGVIPDLVPEDQRGQASGVKTVLELTPVLLIILIGPLIDKGEIGWVIGILIAALLITMVITVLSVREQAQSPGSLGSILEPLCRIAALTAIFVFVTQIVISGIRYAGNWATHWDISLSWKILVIGFVGLLGMGGAILIGVFWGAQVGIGKTARQNKSFTWWVVNRLLFLAAVGSIQGFAQFYLKDVLHVENAATMTSILLGVVALFLIPSAVAGGYYADRIGKKQLIGISGFVAGIGAIFLIIATSFPIILIGGCLIGLASGAFMATSWALGTDLAPKEDAGRYLGVSNLAGAGAGIVGAGIGGPLADFFNVLEPGLGYLILFAIYAGLFFISILSLWGIGRPNTLEVRTD